MSRLSELLLQTRELNQDLAKALEQEVRHLESRRAFGLNFERHTPESVDLYGRQVRLGDKVRMLAPRGSSKVVDKRVWVVEGGGITDGVPTADLSDARTGDTATWPREDLVVVAEERDVIYPGLLSTGKVERGGNKPFHTVINGENLHALKALLYTHRGKVDAIYIDPPYNTGAKDWKYNNDYVADDDLYRHSKWLAFMERRLELAKELLNPTDSVLIVTIDEKEYLRLGLLLEQVFPGVRIQMVSSVINPKGQSRDGQFGRTDEYLYFVSVGGARVESLPLSSEWRQSESTTTADIRWQSLRRAGLTGAVRREDRPGLFYPITVRNDGTGIVSIGEPIPLHEEPFDDSPAGCGTVWPLRSDGSFGYWQVSASALRKLHAQGFVRAPQPRSSSILYLKSGEASKVASGHYPITGHRPDGSVITRPPERETEYRPGTQWRISSHNAGVYGTSVNNGLLGKRSFPFPKSLYAVEDALRFYLKEQKRAVVLDFFAGSGTTAHAIMRLNRQDGGRRQCISVTNNEVSADEQRDLRRVGLRQGDPEWERRGICDYITKPRIEASITGLTPEGTPVKGDYKFTDEFPMADGFEENAEFFTLTYEAPLAVASHREFARIAPLLWLRAGSVGRRIEALPRGWGVAEAYGVVEKLETLDDFLTALSAAPGARLAFIVTDDERRFQSVCAQLPDGVEPVRLYESYLRNFQIDARRTAR